MHLKALCILPHIRRKSLTKTLLIMKFTAMLMVVCSLQLSAKGYSQAISLSLKDVPLTKVFTEIEKQSNYSFVYGKEQMTQTKGVTLSVSNANIETVLNLIFKDQPLTYTITDKYIAVKQRTGLPAAATTATPVDVTGKVVDESGLPMAGVTVSIKGTAVATQTAADGSFTINAPKANSVLVFTNVGYERTEVSLAGKNNVVSITLKVANTSLNEIIVTGYSSQRRD